MNDFHDQARRTGPPRRPAMTAVEFAQLGLGGLAYVKGLAGPQGTVFGIFAADGTQIGAAPELDLAVAAIIQHEMAPARVH